MSAKTTHYESDEAWRAVAVEHFGPDHMQWRFLCPVCGHVASVKDWMDAGAEETAIAFSCVGRWIEGSKQAFEKHGKGPCTYAGGGLFKLNPVTVARPDGDTTTVFDFASAS